MTSHDFLMLAIGADAGVLYMLLAWFGTRALVDWQADRIQARRTAEIVAEMNAKPSDLGGHADRLLKDIRRDAA